MKSLTLFTSALLVTLLAVGPLYSFQEKANQQKDSSLTTSKPVYYCPMHPEVTSDKPATCPKCGMKLEKKQLSTADQQEKMSAMMGKPIFEKSVEGVQVQVWLITQDEHKKMMGTMMQDKKDSSTGGGMMHGEMKDDMNKMDYGMMGTMMQGKKDSSTGGGMMHGEMKHEMKEMDHGKMGEGMKRDMKDAEHNKMMETMMAGTHHVMVTLTDEKSNRSMDKEKVTIEIFSPSGKSGNVELASMMNHFGGGLTLGEKGTYSLNILIEDAQKTRTITVPYEVK